jgi:hypothetical protein
VGVTGASCRLIATAVESFPIDRIAKHLRGEDLERTIVNLIQRVRNVPTSRVKGAQKHLTFMLVLWTMAENEAVWEIQRDDQSWVDGNLTTFGDAIGLSMIILYERDDRVEVTRTSKVANIVRVVAYEENRLMIVGNMLRRLQLDNLFDKELSGGGVLGKLLNGTLRNRDEPLI